MHIKRGGINRLVEDFKTFQYTEVVKKPLKDGVCLSLCGWCIVPSKDLSHVFLDFTTTV